MNTKALARTPMMLAGTLAVGLSAQAPVPRPSTGNPTAGTAQPAPPNPADRLTLIGCVVAASQIRPAGTGSSALAGSATRPTYRLAAIDGALSPFVNTKVEISGELEPSPSGSAEGSAKAPTLRVEFVKKVAPTCS